MSNLIGVTQRDMDARPYSADEQRVAKWLCRNTFAGGGDDPIGFLLTSHEYINSLRIKFKDRLAKIEHAPVPEGNDAAMTLKRWACLRDGEDDA